MPASRNNAAMPRRAGDAARGENTDADGGAEEDAKHAPNAAATDPSVPGSASGWRR